MLNRNAFVAVMLTTAALPAWASETAVQPVVGASRAEMQASLNPLSLMFNEISVNVERRILPNLSVMVTPSFALAGMRSVSPAAVALNANLGLNRNIHSTKHVSNALGLEAGVRYYINDDALSGLFLQPTLAYRHEMASQNVLSRHQMSVAGKLGYQWLVADRLALSTSAGLRYSLLRQANLASQGIAPDLQVSAGVAF